MGPKCEKKLGFKFFLEHDHIMQLWYFEKVNSNVVGANRSNLPNLQQDGDQVSVITQILSFSSGSFSVLKGKDPNVLITAILERITPDMCRKWVKYVLRVADEEYDLTEKEVRFILLKFNFVICKSSNFSLVFRIDSEMPQVWSVCKC